MSSLNTVRGIHKTCSGPYPGYDQQGTYFEPPPNGRTRPEAEPYAQRDHGLLNLFGPKPYTIKTPRVKSRCPSENSRTNMERSQKGTLHNIINGQASHRPDTPTHLRVRPEASEIAENQKGKEMAVILCNSNFCKEIQRKPNESKNSKIPHSLTLLHHSSLNSASYRPAPRVKPEAKSNAQIAKGNEMAAILGVNSEDELAAEKSRTFKLNEASSFMFVFGKESVDAGGNSSQMKNLLSTNNKEAFSPLPRPRVKTEGQQMSRLDQGFRMNKLIHNPGSFSSSTRPLNRNGVSLAARQIAVRNRGTVGDILANIGRKHIVENPGVQR